LQLTGTHTFDITFCSVYQYGYIVQVNKGRGFNSITIVDEQWRDVTT
jgi:hypothetical protein